MRVDGVHYRSIWLGEDGASVSVIDQTRLPHRFEIAKLRSLQDACTAIEKMVVRGAPLIGATAAFGLYLALRDNASDLRLHSACQTLLATRPTAVNLHWALGRMRHELQHQKPSVRAECARQLCIELADEDVDTCEAIGHNGLEVLSRIYAKKETSDRLNVLTHCNAGWLATVDWGTATAAIYKAHDAGLPIHVWVDETRPRNQGANLTAWELGKHGVAHTLITDNAGGHLMQHGKVDLCLVGSDRTARTGEVCNKIGTYLKALAAKDNGVDFYVCLPGSTIDWTITDGLSEIPIEQRDSGEVTHVTGKLPDNTLGRVRIAPDSTAAANYAFDVTPARLVTALITERGVTAASESALTAAFDRLQPAC